MNFFRAAEQLGLLHTLFSGLKDTLHDPGDYLLRHDAKTGAFVRVDKALDSSATVPSGGPYFDLHLAYANSRAAEERDSGPPAWNPIDVGLVAPWQERDGRAPGLFAPPAHTVQQSWRGRGRPRGRGRGRGVRVRGGRGRGNWRDEGEEGNDLKSDD